MKNDKVFPYFYCLSVPATATVLKTFSIQYFVFTSHALHTKLGFGGGENIEALRKANNHLENNLYTVASSSL